MSRGILKISFNLPDTLRIEMAGIQKAKIVNPV
jgi:hypothetical protein